MPKAESSRVTNIQVPGAVPPAADPTIEAGKTDTGAADDAATQDAAPAKTAETPAAIDIEILRDQIRAEERAKLRGELQAAMTVTKAHAPTAQDRPSNQQYGQMRSHEIDPTTLTQAVLSKDGWVCPVAPVPAK